MTRGYTGAVRRDSSLLFMDTIQTPRNCPF